MHRLKIYLLFFLYGLCCQLTLAQSPFTWYSYYNSKNELTGYKDVRGNIKIAPRFGGLTQAKRFNNIIAVSDDVNRTSYYLLKNRKQVGKDSMYVFDMAYDCEQENKIRFRDKKTDKVGFFNKDGKMAIKANFNDAKPFFNGAALVIYNGKRVCADGTVNNDRNTCEHWYWDGITALINKQGTIIADSLDIHELQNINWYSRKLVNNLTDTTLHTFIKAKHGGYYSFVDYQKEFTRWFYQDYLNRNPRQINLSTFNLVSVEGLFKNTLRKFISSKTFERTYNKTLFKKLQAIKRRNEEIQILSEPLNNLIYTQAAFKSYFTDCGEANVERYPLFNVVITINNAQDKFPRQEHLSFLRTDDGYKLIGVAWKTMQ